MACEPALKNFGGELLSLKTPAIFRNAVITRKIVQQSEHYSTPCAASICARSPDAFLAFQPPHRGSWHSSFYPIDSTTPEVCVETSSSRLDSNLTKKQTFQLPPSCDRPLGHCLKVLQVPTMRRGRASFPGADLQNSAYLIPGQLEPTVHRRPGTTRPRPPSETQGGNTALRNTGDCETRGQAPVHTHGPKGTRPYNDRCPTGRAISTEGASGKMPLEGAVAAVRAHTRVLASFQRHLDDFRQRRAAERAAAAAGTSVGEMYEADGDCFVCFEPICRPNAVITRCGHMLHETCCHDLIDRGMPCALCRQPLHRAGLIRVMNGLPTKKDFEIARLDPGLAGDSIEFVSPRQAAAEAAVLRASSAAGSAKGNNPCVTTIDVDSLCDQEVSLIGERRASPSKARPTSPQTSAKTLDTEIASLLASITKEVQHGKVVPNLEVSLRSAIAATEAERVSAKDELENHKQQMADTLAKKRLEVRVERKKLEVREKELVDSQRKMENERVAVKKQMDTLLLKTKSVDELQKTALEREEIAKRKIAEMEDRKGRFINLQEELASKTAMASKKDPVALEEANKDMKSTVSALRNEVDALRRQLRKARNLPPLPPRESRNANDTPSDSQKPPLGKNQLEELMQLTDQDTKDLAEPNPSQRSDSDEDVVAAADQTFYARNPREGKSATANVLNNHNLSFQSDANRAEMIFGEKVAAARQRPAPRRRPASRSAVSLSSFRPPSPPKAPAVRAIATPSIAKSTHNALPVLGRKRLVSPHPLPKSTNGGAGAKRLKHTNGKIKDFFPKAP